MSDETKKLKQQHFDSYKKSVMDIIENNSNLLVNEDIAGLIKKPPLNSMDKIKNKFLSVAKKNKLVVDSDKMEDALEKYRKDVIKHFDEITKSRIDFYNKIVNKFKVDETVKILKKDINSFDKKFKNSIKKVIEDSITKNFNNNINKIISNLDNQDIKDLDKYLTNIYIKDIMESVDIKILVKDATMVNSIKEATETYLFTLENSRLFD